MARTILHLDLDAFFCAVEELANTAHDLRGKAFAVGGRPEDRGVVASCSYAARRYGVRSAMPMSQAVRLCPHLIVVDRHMGQYRAVSQQVMALLHDLTPEVEQVSIDEAFLDVTGLPDTGETIARGLQQRIRKTLKLPVSLGVASNKLVAKIANNVGKAQAVGDEPPNAVTVIPAGQEATFLAPLPVRELWGVGPRTVARLNSMGILTVGDLADWPETDLRRRFGRVGLDLSQRAHGVDERPVVTEREAKSVSSEVTFTRDTRDEQQLLEELQRQAGVVAYRLRKAKLCGRTVAIKLRWSDFTTLTRQLTLDQPTDSDQIIYTAAVRLFRNVWAERRPVRLIGVGVSKLDTPDRPQQLSLWDEPTPPEVTAQVERDSRLQDTLDALRERFGQQVIQRGSDLTD